MTDEADAPHGRRDNLATRSRHRGERCSASACSRCRLPSTSSANECSANTATDAGALELAESIWLDLLALRLSAWLLVLSPYVTVQLARGVRRVWRPQGCDWRHRFGTRRRSDAGRICYGFSERARSAASAHLDTGDRSPNAQAPETLARLGHRIAVAGSRGPRRRARAARRRRQSQPTSTDAPGRERRRLRNAARRPSARRATCSTTRA